ncbi:MAG: murein biosynthesis integral membrane protein MurJ [Desulfobacterales bacterium]|nr:murein biosynthesis integral membrane protein MurJ [Desulfobacterales bacterium]
MSEKSQVIKAAGVVGSATLLSRILGFVRDAVIAWYFGAGQNSDAFIAAFRIPNLLRKLLGEGSISNAFVPVLTDYLAIDGKDEAFRLARSALWLMSVILVVISLGGILMAPLIVKMVAPGFIDAPDKLSLTITLTRIMFPYIFFIGLVALCMGILNVFGHFAAPALAPVLLNLAIIFSVFFLCPHLSTPVLGLAIGVLIGGLLQLTLQLPAMAGRGFRFWQKTKLFHPGLKKISRLIPPIILGGAVYQINVLVGTLLGSFLVEGSITVLYFADRLVQFPLGIFAIAAATAVLPSLSRQAALEDFAGLKDTFGYAVRMTLFMTIPSMVGLIILREPIIMVLFQRGEFSSQATLLTAQALLYYAIGLWAFSAVRIVAATFFALKDTRTPMIVAMVSILANMVLGVVLMKPLSHAGLALATSLASVLNLMLLVMALRKKLGSLGWRRLAQSALKTLGCAVVMGAVVWGASTLIIPTEGAAFIELLVGLLGCVMVGLAVFGTCSYGIKSPEFASMLAELKKGINRK